MQETKFGISKMWDVESYPNKGIYKNTDETGEEMIMIVSEGGVMAIYPTDLERIEDYFKEKYIQRDIDNYSDKGVDFGLNPDVTVESTLKFSEVLELLKAAKG